MIVYPAFIRNWVRKSRPSANGHPPGQGLARPPLSELGQNPAQLPHFVADCPVARKYLTLLEPLDWANFPERNPRRAWPGPQPLARAPFVAAYLVKLHEGKTYMSELRHYLLEHPALVWLLGFPLAPSSRYPWGFDLEATVPTTRQFLVVLRQLDNAALQFLLDNTVQRLQQELPADLNFGQIVAFDTKHILAWVQENNPKTFMPAGRYDKNRQPKADPDCRLGVKKRRNQSKTALPDPATPTNEARPARNTAVAEVYWGYGSGIVVTKLPGWGEFVLAELTLTFDRHDLIYFPALMAATERRLGFRPPFGVGDAAFDAFYVYDYFTEAGGLAVVPLSRRSKVLRTFNEAGLPLCEAGYPMPLKETYICRTAAVHHQRGRYACPLLFPQPTGQPCPLNHKRWPKGGCVVTMPTAPGARLRYQIDREADTFKKLYKHRSATERINALALNLGIERPKLRNRQAITNRNTLIYILLNLRAIQRVLAKKAASDPQSGPKLN
jgi:hypothetical protein